MSEPSFDFMVLTPAGIPDPSLAIAGSRSGAIGVLNLEFAEDRAASLAALAALTLHGRGRIGILIGADGEDLLGAILGDGTPVGLEAVILTRIVPDRLGPVVERVRGSGCRTYLVVTSSEESRAGRDAGVDALIAKGHEAGGWVGEETAFVLLQRLRREIALPVWVLGGVGLHTAASCYVGGAAGAVLDNQMLLTRESPLPAEVRARIEVMDGSETACLGAMSGAPFRSYSRPGLPVVAEFRRLEEDDPGDGELGGMASGWRSALRGQVGWQDPRSALLAVGQDAAFASGLARRFGTVGGVLDAFRRAIEDHCEAARRARPLEEGSALARSHGTRYPIVQGPMTRVSDRAEFADEVAVAGALPMLALALMRAPEIRSLLEETRRLLGDRPWGVGLLGFVPPELRAEQLAVVRDFHPPFALIAGGRPDQACVLEKDGTPTYLHVPSPGLLRMFLQDGAKRFVFEGRECGGHIGPRTSFVLWESMVDVLASHLAGGGEKADEYHILFAGGIHDGPSAAMVSAMAGPLAEKGVRIGVLLGTAYLFTEEAVRAGAILPGFQRAAVVCDRTALLESGPGHATRCAPSPFVTAFAEEKRRLVRCGLPPEELHNQLEVLNIGRLRIASKGVDRHPDHGRDPVAPKLIDLGPEDQWDRGMYMIGQVAALRGETCTMADLHREVSEGGTRCLEATLPASLVADPAPPAPSAVAIVGMGCILPGAPDLQALWANLCNKVDAITEIPASRWDWRLYYDQDRSARDKIYSRWGGFVDDVPFDPVTFGMPPNSLRSIEPFQLLILSAVRAALQDAGYADRPFARDRTSVILGAGGGGADLTGGYMVRSSLPMLFGKEGDALIGRLGGALPEWTEDSFAGILMNVAAGRVANRFDLGGVNYTVDAACASSLAAVYLAVRDLEARTSDVVVVGGVDAIQNPFAYLCFSKTQALSPTGHCRTFDEQGDGIAISEGFAAVIMKRLEDAERDGDRIYAVIRGVGGASDGRDRSLTAPRPEGQVRALRRAYAQAGFSPATVGLIEAHGTGTVAGDQAEVQALSTFFDEEKAGRQSTAIGSIKSMIGHAKATAGVSGLIKTALALHYRVLPPTIGVTQPNPKANFPESPFYVNTETRPWVHGDDAHPRRAGISAFGFGGTNFHVVAEEYTGAYGEGQGSTLEAWPAELLIWRGRSRAEILEAVVALGGKLERGARPRLSDLAYTTGLLAAANEIGWPTLAIVATSLDDLSGKLRAARALLEGGGNQTLDTPGVRFAEVPLANEGRVAFLFPGQGSQYPGMVGDLAVAFPEVRACFDRADRALAGLLPRPLSRYIFPPPAFSPEDKQKQQEELTSTEIAQPSLGAAGLALSLLLRSLGVEPGMTAGHSYGEFVSLCAAGCFDEATLLRISEARGRFIREGAADGGGAMAAIEATPEELRPLLEDPGLSLANLNAPGQTVISGQRLSVERAVAWCESAGIQARLLPVSCAFHSPIVEPAQRRLAEELARIPFNLARVPVFSNTTAAPYPEDPREIAGLLAGHLVSPVRFVDQVRAMHQAGARIFVEVGPRAVLSGLVGRILEGQPHLCVPLDKPGRDGLVQLLQGLAALVAEGVPLRHDQLYRGRSARRLDLATLESETGLPKLSPTTWMVNGGKARPMGQPARPATSTRPTRPADRTAPTPGPAGPLSGPASAVAAPARSLTRPSNGLAAPPGVPRPAGVTPPSRLEPVPSPRDGRFGNPHAIPVSAARGGASRPAPASPRLAETKSQYARPSADRGGLIPMENGSHAQPPALPGEYAADLMRQFQHVMQCFLHTQGSVMHDLTMAYMGSLNAGHGHEARPIPSPLAGNGNGHEAWQMPTALARNGNRPANGNGNGAPHAGYAAPATGVSMRLAPSSPPTPPSNGSAHASPMAATFDGPPVQDFAPTAPNPIVGASRVAKSPVARQETHPPAPAPVAEVAVAADTKEIIERLLAVVSERTGYPPEMLSLDADMEADLGIDSIKRVEISGTIVRSLAMPAGELVDVEQLTGSRTLRQVIETLETLISRAGASAAPANRLEGGRDPFDGARAGSGIGRFALKAVAAPAVGPPGGLSRAGVVVIIDEETGVGGRLAGRLGDLGYRAALVASGAGLGRPDEVARLVDRLHQEHGPVSALVHLGSLRPGDDRIGQNADGWRACLDADLKSLFLLVQAFRADLERAAAEGGAAVLAATALGGGFAVADPRPDAFPGQGGMVGLLKTLAQEWPSVRVKAVDTPAADPGRVADWLLEELFSGDGLVEVGYLGGRRTRLDLVATPLGEASSSPPLDADSVVLITGGARGITAEAAMRIAENYRSTLLLVGRTPATAGSEPADTAGLTESLALKRALIGRRGGASAVSPAVIEDDYRRLLGEREVRQTLDHLRRSGSRVEYLTCDVRDAEAFARLVDEVYRTHGRIDGVIHGAGVIEDKLVRDKRLDSFERVVETKVESALVLASRLRPETLRFLVFFSSVSGRFGNRGQGDYAAASEVLNKLAQDLDRRWPSRVVSINWGPWLKTGMVSPEVQRQFAERGVALIPPDVGCRMLDEELRLGRKGEVEILIGGARGLDGGSDRRTDPAEARPALPLLVGSGPIERGEGGVVELTRTLTLERDLYLDDHRIDGRLVLPFAVATELMAETAAAGWPGWEVGAVRGVHLLKGVTVEGAGVSLRVSARPRGETGRAGEGPMLDLTITSGPDFRLTHYRATVEMSRDPGSDRGRWTAEVAGGESRVLEGAVAFPMGVDEAYRSWLFHGPMFQGIVSIDSIGPGGARAILRPSDPRDCLGERPAGDWLFDPVLVDSALQMQVLWARLHWDVTLLPHGVGEFRWFGPLRSGSTGSTPREIHYELRVRPESQAPMSHADHLFYDSDGRLLGLLAHVEGTGSKALNRLAGGARA